MHSMNMITMRHADFWEDDRNPHWRKPYIDTATYGGQIIHQEDLSLIQRCAGNSHDVIAAINSGLTILLKKLSWKMDSN